MDMYPKYKSKLGYQNGNNQIDSYGVDHSSFDNLILIYISDTYPSFYSY